jgi:hypothetical protein
MFDIHWNETGPDEFPVGDFLTESEAGHIEKELE